MISAIKVNGNWDEGYVLDFHVANSEYAGDDVFGHPRFKNTYTKIGQLLHSMKYNGHIDTSSEIAEYCHDFLDSWLSDKNIDIVLPVPPTKQRDIQPVFLISEAIADSLNVWYSSDILIKTTTEQAKNMSKDNKVLSGTVKKLKLAKRKCNILLIDDIISTGSTASECVSVLKTDPLIRKIYFLAITKTK